MQGAYAHGSIYQLYQMNTKEEEKGMEIKQIEIPSRVLLEALGYTAYELVDIDLDGNTVKLTVTEGDTP